MTLVSLQLQGGACKVCWAGTPHRGLWSPHHRNPLPGTHIAVKKVAIVAWCLVPVYAIWSGFIVISSTKVVGIGVFQEGFSTPHNQGPSPFGTWSFLPNDLTGGLLVGIIDTSLSTPTWPAIISTGMLIQGALTLGLHCCEAVVNTVRDEMIWRKATGNPAKAARLAYYRCTYLLAWQIN